MKPSVRLRLCTNCGHLIVRSATSSQSFLGRMPIRQDSRRSISWKSLFDVFTNPEKSDGSTVSPKDRNDESRARTKAAVQRLRETRDQTRRPLNPPVGPSEGVSASASSPTPQIPPQSPSDQLREKLKQRLSLIKPNIKQPEATTAATIDTQSYRLQRKAMHKFDLSSHSDPKYKTGSFPTALRSEQREALMKYLSLASTKKEPPKRHARFPWEEPPLPSETGHREVRDLLTLKSAPEPSEVDKSIQGTPDYHVIESADLTERLATSKLFQQLQTHHVEIQKALIEGNKKLLVAANYDLTNNIDSTIQQIESRFGSPNKYGLLFQKFRTLLGPSNDVQIRITPFIRYITAEQGFNPRDAYNIINKLPKSFGAEPFDNQNRLTTEALEAIILDRMSSF